MVPARKVTARSLLGAMRSRAWVLEGNERSGGDPLRLFFAGGEKQKEYLRLIAFAGEVREHYLGEQGAWRTLRMLGRNRVAVDIAMIEGGMVQDWLYRQPGDRVLPMWLRTVVDIPLVASRRSAREDMRRIQVNSLGYHVTTDLASVRAFHQSMYRPFILAGHGRSAVETSQASMVAKVREGKCELLTVTMGGQDIAGVLIVREPIPQLWCAGVLNADPRWRRAGAIPATYVFASEHLVQQGFSQMSMGLSRGFLADGVLQYKNKWDHRIFTCTSIGFLLRVCQVTPGTRAFLCTNPFVYREDDRLYGAVFVDPGSVEGVLDPAAVTDRYRVDGLAGVHVFRADMASSHPEATVPL